MNTVTLSSKASSTDIYTGLEFWIVAGSETGISSIPNGKKAYMIGSLIQQNFGETISKHGYGVYQITEDEYSFVDLPNPKPFLSFYIDSFDNLATGNEKLVNY